MAHAGDEPQSFESTALRDECLRRSVEQAVLCDPAFPVPEASYVGPSPHVDARDSWIEQLFCESNQGIDRSRSWEPPGVRHWWLQGLQRQASPNLADNEIETPSGQHSGFQSRLQRCGGDPAYLLFLRSVNKKIIAFMDTEENGLELPKMKGKANKTRVSSLASLYGLEPRCCGRKGTTLFKADQAGLPNQDKQCQIDDLLMKGILPFPTEQNNQDNSDTEHAQKVIKTKPKPKKKKKKRAHSAAGKAAQPKGTALLPKPSIVNIDAPALDDKNVGNRMLLSMGWKAGTGLGSASQGQTEPIPIVKRRKNLGLGA